MIDFPALLRQRNQPLLGTWVKIPALETVELLGRAGFDYIAIDMEHGPLGLESAYRAIVVAQGLGMAALVRVPDLSGSYVQRLLDAGADGLLVPRVQTREQARRAIASMVFAPEGERGYGITSRAGHWGLQSRAEYLQQGHNQVLRCVQLEDLAALESAEQIIALPDLGAVFIGMGDLLLSTGRRSDDAELDVLVQRVLDLALSAGIPVGTAVGDAKAAREAQARGFRFVMVSNDATMFGRAAARLSEDSRG